MNGWQKFLDSLATKGGNLLLLTMFVGCLLGLTLHVLHHGDDNQATTVILSTFSGFSGALLAALTGQMGGQRKTDNGNGVTRAPTGPYPIPKDK